MDASSGSLCIFPFFTAPCLQEESVNPWQSRSPCRRTCQCCHAPWSRCCPCRGETRARRASTSITPGPSEPTSAGRAAGGPRASLGSGMFGLPARSRLTVTVTAISARGTQTALPAPAARGDVTLSTSGAAGSRSSGAATENLLSMEASQGNNGLPNPCSSWDISPALPAPWPAGTRGEPGHENPVKVHTWVISEKPSR